MSQANRGRVFLPSRQKLAGLYECRGTKWLEGCEIVMVFQNCLGGNAQCRGRNCLGGRNLSWLPSFIASSARIRVQLSFLICLGSWVLFAKTVTSQLTFIVRVSLSDFIFVSLGTSA